MSLLSLTVEKWTHRQAQQRCRTSYHVKYTQEQKWCPALKFASSIPMKLIGYLCNRLVHPSQVYSRQHSLYLLWSGDLCKLVRENNKHKAQKELLLLLHMNHSLQSILMHNQEASNTEKEKKSEVLLHKKEKLPNHCKEKELGKRENVLDTGKTENSNAWVVSDF